uniref:G_PROTEIN_RECEP_F1_2 domain-containing protein n=1 Tax=Steinernema glaseri TaxID=37863 RepID=A0A1I7ZYP6_9BILA
MDDKYSYIYNRMLDLTAVGSMTIKPLCIYIVIKKTPKFMKILSYFMLNELIWTFVHNTQYTLGHPIPMMPAMCYRMDGLVSDWMKTEEQRAMFFLALTFTAVNSCIGIAITFIVRYLALAFGKKISPRLRAWCYLFCVIAHIMVSVILGFLYRMWMIPISEYPESNLPKDTKNFFCFHPGGTELRIVLCMIIMLYGGTTMCIALFAGLCVRELRLNRHLLEKRTLDMQKEVQNKLLIITGAAMLVGTLPLGIYSVYICNGQWPFTLVIISVAMFFYVNHGTVYAVLILCLFTSYRKATIAMVKALKSKLWKALRIKSTTEDVVFQHVNSGTR